MQPMQEFHLMSKNKKVIWIDNHKDYLNIVQNMVLLVTHIIKDVGSGLNDNRSGFVKLTDLVIQGKVNKLVVEHKDRLTRFQFKFMW